MTYNFMKHYRFYASNSNPDDYRRAWFPMTTIRAEVEWFVRTKLMKQTIKFTNCY